MQKRAFEGGDIEYVVSIQFLFNGLIFLFLILNYIFVSINLNLTS